MFMDPRRERFIVCLIIEYPLGKLNLGFALLDRPARHSTVAAKHDLSSPTIARNSIVVGLCFLKNQQMWLTALLKACEKRKPLAVCLARKWDETKGEVTMHNIRDHRHLMVGSARIVVQWAGDIPALCVDVVVPTVPVMGTSAECMYGGILAPQRHIERVSVCVCERE